MVLILNWNGKLGISVAYCLNVVNKAILFVLASPNWYYIVVTWPHHSFIVALVNHHISDIDVTMWFASQVVWGRLGDQTSLVNAWQVCMGDLAIYPHLSFFFSFFYPDMLKSVPLTCRPFFLKKAIFTGNNMSIWRFSFHCFFADIN